jgi:hypothetical protein
MTWTSVGGVLWNRLVSSRLASCIKSCAYEILYWLVWRNEFLLILFFSVLFHVYWQVSIMMSREREGRRGREAYSLEVRTRSQANNKQHYVSVCGDNDDNFVSWLECIFFIGMHSCQVGGMVLIAHDRQQHLRDGKWVSEYVNPERFGCVIGRLLNYHHYIVIGMDLHANKATWVIKGFDVFFLMIEVGGTSFLQVSHLAL